jgi:hypothetical protein
VHIGPAGIQSIVATLRLPPQAAQALQGQSVPVHFEVTMAGGASRGPVQQREKSTFYVPR